MKTTIENSQGFGATTRVTKAFDTVINGDSVTISVTRRFVDVNTQNPFISELEYSICTDGFSKTRMGKRSFLFHIDMVRRNMFN